MAQSVIIVRGMTGLFLIEILVADEECKLEKLGTQPKLLGSYSTRLGLQCLDMDFFDCCTVWVWIHTLVALFILIVG